VRVAGPGLATYPLMSRAGSVRAACAALVEDLPATVAPVPTSSPSAWRPPTSSHGCVQ
jgi:hypothetical protein